MAQIIIERPNELFYQSAINSIYIDGVKIGTVTTGKSLDHNTTPGKHTIVTKSRWGGDSKAIEVEVGIDETKIIKLTAVRFMFWLPVLMPFVIATIIYFS